MFTYKHTQISRLWEVQVVKILNQIPSVGAECGPGEAEEGKGRIIDNWRWKETSLRVVNNTTIYRRCIVELYT